MVRDLHDLHDPAERDFVVSLLSLHDLQDLSPCPVPCALRFFLCALRPAPCAFLALTLQPDHYKNRVISFFKAVCKFFKLLFLLGVFRDRAFKMLTQNMSFNLVRINQIN